MPNFRQSVWTYQPVVPGNLRQASLTPDDTQLGDSLSPNPIDVYGGVELHSVRTSDAGYTYPHEADNSQPTAVRVFRKRGGVGNFYRLSYPEVPVLPDNAFQVGLSTTMAVIGAPPPMEQEENEHQATKQQLREKVPLPVRPQSPWQRFRNLFFADPREVPGRDEHVNPQVGRLMPTDQNLSGSEGGAPAQAFMIPDPEQTFNTPVGENVRKAGWNLTPDDLQPSPYRVENVRRPVEYGPESIFLDALPDRFRAGVAHPSEGRPAQMPQWFSYRPFDQEIAQHGSGQKGVVRVPLAARPVTTKNEDVSTGYASFGGNRRVSPAPGMTPVSVLPNTDRQVPQPWDQNLYVNANQAPYSRRKFTF